MVTYVLYVPVGESPICFSNSHLTNVTLDPIRCSLAKDSNYLSLVLSSRECAFALPCVRTCKSLSCSQLSPWIFSINNHLFPSVTYVVRLRINRSRPPLVYQGEGDHLGGGRDKYLIRQSRQVCTQYCSLTKPNNQLPLVLLFWQCAFAPIPTIQQEIATVISFPRNDNVVDRSTQQTGVHPIIVL